MKREVFNLFTYEAVIVVCWLVTFCQVGSNTDSRIDNCTVLEIVDVPVRLTRLKTVAKTQNLFERLFRKTKQVIEYYNATKPVVRRACCKGYRLNETSQLCDIPICERPCEADRFCIRPNYCGCLDDYVEVYNSETSQWYCAPYCKPPCSDDGNKCVKQSYCDNAELSEERFGKEYAFEPEYGEYGHDNNNPEHNDIEFDLSNVTTEASDCPYNYVFYHGKCRFMNLSTVDTTDCRKQPCRDLHSVCLTNGTCVCEEGYIWIDGQQDLNENATTSEEQADQGFCLLLSAYLNPEDDEFLNYKLLIIVAVTALSVVLLIIYLIVRYGCKSKGNMTVDDEHLSCVYKNSPQTVI